MISSPAVLKRPESYSSAGITQTTFHALIKGIGK